MNNSSTNTNDSSSPPRFKFENHCNCSQHPNTNPIKGKLNYSQRNHAYILWKDKNTDPRVELKESGNLSRADLEIEASEPLEVLLEQPLGVVLSDLLPGHV